LHNSFSRLKTGSTKNICLSFRFVVGSRKKSLHISVKSHNAEVKLCNLYQFAEAFSGIASCKIFCSFFMLNHFAIKCTWSQARSHGGAMGAIAPPLIPKVAPKIFRSNKLLISKPKKYFSANHRKCLRNLLHNLVEPDQITVVQQLSMIDQTLCTRGGGHNRIFQVKPRIFVGWAKTVKFHFSTRSYVNNIFC